uniref:S8 family peptidase n=1 Tax=uncultured Dysgonomonas sp. TaxID=206096 RepID=UPI002617CA59|nr:S8 family serine peptidase [uncultured Dysgonomonas sp.]
MAKYIFLIIITLYNLNIFSSEGYMFRVQLKDKGQTGYTIDKPEEFLSKRAIERRKRQNISIDNSDLPISSAYINVIEELGCTVVAKSKWLQTVSIYCNDSLFVEKINQLDFVDSTTFAWKGDTARTTARELPRSKRSVEKPKSEYGYGDVQIKTVNGNFLHKEGYKGKGMEIAVIDAGYTNLKEILLLDNVSIKGVKDFVYNGNNIFESSDHGLKVLSVMASNRPNIFVGTAPEAKYWLLRSEDSRSEFPIEEDYWAAAAEYADSIGVDIINASLGYHTFNAPAKSYTHEQLDGKTAYITRAANMAASKGIFVEVSAGNDGANIWEKIAFPSDAANVLTVGAIARDSTIAYFSSRGLTADGRIKPDVVAVGFSTAVIASTGEVDLANGTSFSGPVMSGLAACLWQSAPSLTNIELLDIIRKSSDKYATPDGIYGYGIPNMKTAFLLAGNTPSGIENEGLNKEPLFDIKSDSIGYFSVSKKEKTMDETYTIRVFTLDGKVIMTDTLREQEQSFYLPNYPKQMKIIAISGTGVKESYKIIF